MKIGRHHSYDLPTDSLEIDRPADDARVSSEALLPKIVAHYDIIVLARRVFSRRESSSEFSAGAQDREQLGGNRGAGQPHGVADMSQVEFMSFGISCDVHGTDLLAHGGERALGIRSCNAYQFGRAWIGKWPQKDSADQTEDGSVGADSESERKRRNRREPKALV